MFDIVLMLIRSDDRFCLVMRYCFFLGEVTSSFSYQCRNTEEINRMWDQCKISIGKRCQNLRKTQGK